MLVHCEQLNFFPKPKLNPKYTRIILEKKMNTSANEGLRMHLREDNNTIAKKQITNKNNKYIFSVFNIVFLKQYN